MDESLVRSFETELIPSEAGGTGYVVPPFSVEQVWGTRAQLRVAGTVNGVPFRGSLFPRGDGTHYMVLNRAVRAAAGVAPGDRVRLTLAPDSEPRVVEVPAALQAALEGAPEAAAFWDSLSYSHQKEYADWLTSAKREATRARRLEKAIVMLSQGQSLK